MVSGKLQADAVTRLVCAAAQINGKLDHVRHCGRENGQHMEEVHSPDILVMPLVVLLSETKFGGRCLKFRIDDHRNQSWNLIGRIGKGVQCDVFFFSFNLCI